MESVEQTDAIGVNTDEVFKLVTSAVTRVSKGKTS
jgi:hypothetical protein